MYLVGQMSCVLPRVSDGFNITSPTNYWKLYIDLIILIGKTTNPTYVSNYIELGLISISLILPKLGSLQRFLQVSWALEVCYLRRHSAAAAALASASAAARGAGAALASRATGIDTEESGEERVMREAGNLGIWFMCWAVLGGCQNLVTVGKIFYTYILMKGSLYIYLHDPLLQCFGRTKFICIR